MKVSEEGQQRLGKCFIHPTLHLILEQGDTLARHLDLTSIAMMIWHCDGVLHKHSHRTTTVSGTQAYYTNLRADPLQNTRIRLSIHN